MAQQTWTGAFAGSVAFLASAPHAASYCGNRISFFGRDGSPDHPDSLNQIHLDNQCGAGLDPCGALQVTVSILPGEERDVVFLARSGSVERWREGRSSIVIRRYRSVKAELQRRS